MDPAKLKVVELRAELTKRGLDSKGNKPVLVERLKQALAGGKPTDAPTKVSQSSSEKDSDSEESEPEPETRSTRRAARTSSRSSRTSRQSSRERTTPVKTPTRRSSSRSSATGQSPAKATIAESLSDASSTLEPIAEEEKTSPREESVPEAPKKEPVAATPKKVVAPAPASKKETTAPASTPKKEDAPAPTPKKDVTPAPTPKKEVAPTPPPKKEAVPEPSPKKDVAPVPSPKKETAPATPKVDTVTATSKKEADVSTPKKESVTHIESPRVKLQIVKEAEKHVLDNSQVIIKKIVEEVTKPVVQSPAKPEVQSPAKPAAESPAKPLPQSPAVPAVSQSPVKPAPESPAKPIAQSPIKSSDQSPVKPVAESPAKPVADSPAKAPAQSPAKPVADSPVKTPVQSPAKPVAESPAKPVAESPVKTPAQSPAKPVAESPAKDATESPIKTATQSLNKSISPVKAATPQKKEQSPVKSITGESPHKKLKTDNADSMQTDEQSDSDLKPIDEAMEVDQENDAKVNEAEHDHKDGRSEERKRKRSPSPHEEAPRAPPIARPENEPNFDESAVLLSWYDSDLHLVINPMNYFSASPMQGDGFNFMWAGARTTYGFNKGKVFFEARVDSEFDNIAASAGANTSGAIPADDEKIPSLLRLGWSTICTTLQLGEEKLSYGYEGTGKKAANSKFVEYGKSFAKGNIVGCYADFETDGKVTLTYTVDGETQGPAFVINKEELGDKALFPHVLSKNCSFTLNFGQEEPWSTSVLDGYQMVGKVDINDRVKAPGRPEKRENCEVILLCGLPFSGKTAWATKHVAKNPEKMYCVLGISHLIDKMKVEGTPLKENFKGRWETVVEKVSRALIKLLESAPSRRRNYILDQQANVYGSAQKRKMRNFYGFHRKAVILLQSDEEFKAQIAKRKETDGEEIRETSILEVKASLCAPTMGESFEEVEWGELNEEEGKKLIETYNAEGKLAGFGQSQHQSSKRSRYDGGGGGGKDRNNRDNRDNRDHRRSGFSDRRNSGAWSRGGAGGGGGGGGGGDRWRDGGRRGGPNRHSSGGYGSPGGWNRGGGRGGGSNDRRQGNDRNRQRGWGGGYQSGGGNWQGGQGVWANQQAGYQQGGYNQSGGGQQSWGGNNSANWKGYNQSGNSGYGGQSGSNYGGYNRN